MSGKQTRTGYGFYYFPDEEHYRVKDFEAWRHEFSALGISWITLRGSFERAIPEHFTRGLQEMGITPLVHIPAKIQAPDLAAIDSLMHTYARRGVEHVVVYDQPNDRSSWQQGLFERQELVDRFLDLWIPIADTMLRHGLRPIFPALKQGGVYWDTAFLDTALQQLNKRKKYDLTNALILAVYGHAFDRAANWGAGGAKKWPNTRPYRTPVGSEDHIGFRTFEWYQDIANANLNHAVPTVMIAGGAVEKRTDGQSAGTKSTGWHANCNIDIIKSLTDESAALPSYLKNVNFWLLSANPNSKEHAEAWYRADNSVSPAATQLKQLAQQRKQRPLTEKSVGSYLANTAEPDRSKPIFHYLMLPTFEWGPAKWHWDLVHDYVTEFQPTTGYSITDARLAQYVSIVGNEQGVSKEIELELKRCGCVVERIAGTSGDEIKSQLDGLVSNKTRFRTIASGNGTRT